MRDGYSVTVSKNGEPILTIERRMLSGIATFSDEERQAVRDAGENLLAFIGPDKTACFLCDGIDQCEPDCPFEVYEKVRAAETLETK